MDKLTVVEEMRLLKETIEDAFDFDAKEIFTDGYNAEIVTEQITYSDGLYYKIKKAIPETVKVYDEESDWCTMMGYDLEFVTAHYSTLKGLNMEFEITLDEDIPTNWKTSTVVLENQIKAVLKQELQKHCEALALYYNVVWSERND